MNVFKKIISGLFIIIVLCGVGSVIWLVIDSSRKGVPQELVDELRAINRGLESSIGIIGQRIDSIEKGLGRAQEIQGRIDSTSSNLDDNNRKFGQFLDSN